MAEFREPQVVLFSTDVTRSAAFYASLGFEEVFRTPVTGVRKTSSKPSDA